MHRCRNLAARLALAAGAIVLSGSQVLGSANAQSAAATEVYRIDFESGPDALYVIGPSVTVTEAPGEVIEGAKSLKLSGSGASIVLRPDVIRLQPSKIYIVEYRYRAISSDTPWALGVGFSLTGPDGQSHYLPLRGPVAASASTGVDARSARAGGVNDAFVFHTWNGAVVIDDIRIFRHDVEARAAAPATIDQGFPRLANYALLAPDTIALINNVRQSEVEQVAARYDLMMGTSFDHTLGAASWVRRLRSMNPRLRILPYKQAFMAQFEGGIESSGLVATFNNGLQPSWFMRSPSGELLSEPAFPQNVQLNHTPFSEVVNGHTPNSYTADFLAENVLSSGLWSGIHFDQPEWYINPLLGDPPPDIDLDGDGAAEPLGTVQHAWALGFFDYFSKMAARLPADTLLYGNAGHIPGNQMVLPMLNGWQGEVISPYPIAPGGNWITDAPSKWYRLLANYRLATTYARAPQIVSLQFTGRELGTQTGGLTPNGYPQRLPQLEWRDYQRMRLGLTTTLLGNGFFEYDLVDNTTPPQWFDEFAVDESGSATTSLSGKGYLGQPLGDAEELPYQSSVIFQLDFESGATPSGVTLGPGTVSSDPAHVIAGTRSMVVTQNSANDNSWLFESAVPLVPGRTYQLLADYKIIDYRPTTYAGLLGIGFRDASGAMPPERSGSLFLPDTGGPGQLGTLRAAVKIMDPNTVAVGGMTDTGAVAIDNVSLIEGAGGVWRRDFENGIVLVNPTPEPQFVSQQQVAGPRNRSDVRRIRGTQVPAWNDGSPVSNGIWLAAGDGIVLLAGRMAAPIPGQVQAVQATTTETAATISWTPIADYTAGYVIRFGESLEHLTRSAAAGPTAWAKLDNLAPGTTYVARLTAIDFLGREGSPRDFTFVTGGSAALRPTFALAAETPVLAPGAVATIVGDRLSAISEDAPGPIFPLTLGGTTVRVNGIAAALLAVTPNRVSFLVPWQVVGPEAVVSVTHDEVAAPERRAAVVAAQPWLFTWPGSDVVIATHSTGDVVSAALPASAGQAVDVMAVGLGAASPHPDNGVPVAGPHLASVSAAVSVTIGGVPASVVGAWVLPGTAATYGIRVSIPDGLAPGLQPLVINVGGVTANPSRLPIQ
jgi:uncharacterized protein (TIGR03437 family)